MTARVLIVVARNEVQELGNENRGLVVGIARRMRWRMEQPFARHSEVPELLPVVNEAD